MLLYVLVHMCVRICAVICPTMCRCVKVCVWHEGECRIIKVTEGQKRGAAPSCRAKRHPANPLPLPAPPSLSLGACRCRASADTCTFTHTCRHAHVPPQSCLELAAEGEWGKRAHGDICKLTSEYPVFSKSHLYNTANLICFTNHILKEIML